MSKFPISEVVQVSFSHPKFETFIGKQFRGPPFFLFVGHDELPISSVQIKFSRDAIAGPGH